MVKEFNLSDPVATVDSCAAELAGVSLTGLDFVTCQGHNNHNAVKAGLNTVTSKRLLTYSDRYQHTSRNLLVPNRSY